MGDGTLTPAVMDAFVDELQKLGGLSAVGGITRSGKAALTSMGRGVSSVGDLLQPSKTVDTLRKGWKSFEPLAGEAEDLVRGAERAGSSFAEHAKREGLPLDPATAARYKVLRSGGESAAKLREAGPKPGLWEGRSKRLGGTGAGAERSALEKDVTRRHIGAQSQPLRDVMTNPEELAKELSRRGWTGTGKMTRYLPVGGKSWMTGFGAGLLPGTLKKEDPTGKGHGRMQRMGEHVGQHAGFIAGMPTGLLGSILAGEVARKGLGTAGKGVDWMGSQMQRRDG